MKYPPKISEVTSNFSRYRFGQKKGHFETYSIRAAHPVQSQAFWIRYTLFSPQHHPEQAVGQLWAVVFDPDLANQQPAFQELPLIHCHFSNQGFNVAIGSSRLEYGRLTGQAGPPGPQVRWDLKFAGGMPPLFFLPRNLYHRRFPNAKTLVSQPMAVFQGKIWAWDKEIEIQDWVGSLNHHWGATLPEQYAWGQVAGFDNSPESFLEVATARFRVGPWHAPDLTAVVLRHQGKEYALNRLGQAMRAEGSFDFSEWKFASQDHQTTIYGLIRAPERASAPLPLPHPASWEGNRQCLTTGLASCRIKAVFHHPGEDPDEVLLLSEHKAGLEIFYDPEPGKPSDRE